MLYVNRRGEFNDSMFAEMEQFAQQMKTYCCGQDMFLHTAKINVGGVDKFKVEDIRIVFNKPKQVQLKCRVSELLSDKGLISFKKTDTVKLIIETKAPSKEPDTIIVVSEWFDELEGLVPNIKGVVEIPVMPNKWLYLRGVEQ